MSKRCRTCASKKSPQVMGFEDAPYVEIAAAVVTNYAASKVDEMLTTDETGAPKPGFLTDNPMIKNAMYIGAGVALTAFMQGEMYKGAGIGLAAYGGMELIKGLMTDTTTGVTGLMWQPPQNIAGLRQVPGNYGVSPSIVAGTDYEASNYAKEEIIEKQAVSGLVRAM